VSATTTPTNQLLRLDGKSAVITGAASGIGLAIAQRFAASGARVHVLDRTLDESNAAVKSITSSGGQAFAHACDVTSLDAVRKTLDAIAATGLDILINNAGIAHIGTAESTTPEDFDRVLAVNVKGVYHCLHIALPHMVARSGGAIVNLASIAASSGLADRFAYSATKGAVLSMTYSVARDYVGKGIRCNAISPARVHTPFVDGYISRTYPGREAEMFAKLSQSQPIGRMGQPHEVANLALFLCSDAAAFITGVDYPLDGGFFNLHG
jgi:NAD(P)-dependent dehydrogenase (short-subunit alcohol dehydrogenase family)